ncbi:hypothetical protein HMPREF1624_03998 [Sporothrix schenckii ATCC 58251]|uniref:Glycoside hydrolase family 5 domain-containing protein n=1 Tax=Sporothrix schenckii (strain ATCC 58251 / de Perez 2211183) TaxID=1391915 RepID=U7PT36_SPOS1|nr:hypothetical protein HMPREF1624_03998 [Sporothrix schenckii ATCC 58251]
MVFLKVATPAVAVAVSLFSLPSASASLTAGNCTAPFVPITATEFVQNLNPGWNLGNTLDAVPDEGSWNNPKVTPDVFATVKASGFRSVRIPVTYADHFVSGSPAWTINSTWLARVAEVVQMATDAGLYVVTNMHHDSWRWADVTKEGANQTEIAEKFAAAWRQIARTLACAPSSVALEPINEPPANTAEDGQRLNHLNQLFLAALTDGHNPQRVVTLVGGGEDAEKSSLWFERPANTTTNPWTIQFHYYSPYSFIFGAWGKTIWGSEDDKAAVVSDLTAIHNNFTDLHLVLGEFDASPTNVEASARWRYTDFLVRTARSLNISVMYWDNGIDNLDRAAGQWRDPTSADLVVSAATAKPGVVNSLPAGTTNDTGAAATTQATSAYVFQRVGAPITDQALPYLFNGNNVTAIRDGSAALAAGNDYAVNSTHILLSASYLAKHFAPTAPAGIRANLTIVFSGGAVAMPLQLVLWDVPVLASTTSVASLNTSADDDLAIPVAYKGLPLVAAVRLTSLNGTGLVDTWTQYLGPLQQQRATYNSHWKFDEGHVIITADALKTVVATREPAVFTFEFYPRTPGNAVNYTLTV